MEQETKKSNLEDKLIEELEEDSSEEGSKGNKKLLIIGGSVAGVLVLVAIILSLMPGKKPSQTTPKNDNISADQESASSGVDSSVPVQPEITYDQNFSRGAGSTVAEKVGEPNQGYPEKTSGARVPVDGNGNSIENKPIQKSLMIDEKESPFFTLHTIAPEVYDLMEINLYNVQNKRLSLGELLDRVRLRFPDAIFNRLDSDYRVFMYRAPDEKGPGTTLIFSTGMDKNELNTALKGWEGTMVDDFRSFINIGLKKDFVEASGQKTFQDSSLYRGSRFVDFSGNGVVSLSYMVLDKYIIFSNSRTSFEEVIKLLKK